MLWIRTDCHWEINTDAESPPAALGLQALAVQCPSPSPTASPSDTAAASSSPPVPQITLKDVIQCRSEPGVVISAQLPSLGCPGARPAWPAGGTLPPLAERGLSPQQPPCEEDIVIEEFARQKLDGEKDEEEEKDDGEKDES
ncbi:hypothetical protein NDU88_000747 [Pleurodeles waltl]|uniref:Uncharacterized protein n=1 Tax=Pleurodeles waltl TaxID=8319 RepID=A0AAV7V9X6_PLEWA|nr:hypothetical protein NDU88_000747 [Pleurodeles waltl]